MFYKTTSFKTRFFLTAENEMIYCEILILSCGYFGKNSSWAFSPTLPYTCEIKYYLKLEKKKTLTAVNVFEFHFLIKV